jgi:hypothetical protein
MNLGVIDSILCLLCANFRFMSDLEGLEGLFRTSSMSELFFFGPLWVTTYSSV